jgi:dienelactone hydrolase
MRRSFFVGTVALAAVLRLAVQPSAQSKPTLAPADYDQFESMTAAAGRGGLSPDGRWLATSITRVGGNNELRVAQVNGTISKTVPYASGAAYSSNSQWIAYLIGVSEAERERLTAARQPLRRKLGILNLETQAEAVVEGIDTFAFDRTGQSIAIKRAAPAPAAGAAAPAAAPAPGRGGGAPAAATSAVGGTLLVRDLAGGATMTFGNVKEYAWQPQDGARLLAMTISADGQAGNGVQIFDAGSSVLRALEAGATDYSTLVWRDDSSDLLVLKAKIDAGRDGPTQVVLAWTGVGSAAERLRTLDPTANNALPADRRIVTFRRPSWLTGASSAGPLVMLGVAEWPARTAPALGARGVGARGAGAAPAGGAPGPPPAAPNAANQRPDVDVWHWTDVRVNPAQKRSLAADRRRNLPAVWHPFTGAVVALGKTFDETVSPIRHTSMAIVADGSAYAMERSIGRGATDLAIVDVLTGARTPLRANVTGSYSTSTGGGYLIFSEGGHYWTIDLGTRTVTNITAGLKTSFVNLASDSTAPQKPMFGIGGWTKDDESVVLYDEFDVWQVSPTGAGGTRLTAGAVEQVRHRILAIGAEPGDPLNVSGAYVSLFGTHTKKSGYGRLPATAGGAVSRLVWLDKGVAGLAKAEKADVYSHRIMGADDPPDLYIGGADLAGAAQKTATNAFLSKYAWSRAELVDYVVTRGRRKVPLQGVLRYPANYEPGRKYPMVVYLYERLSDGLHNFQNPSERDYYNGTTLTQNGYFFFQPDIVFAPREPGVSVVECVTAAVNKVVSMGAVDAAKIGVMGHSWGGFDAMYLSTHSKIFAAAVSGAGISNLISNYGNHHWSSGIAETDHIETGQQRMVVPLFDDLQAYIRNSAVFGVSTMTTPLLLMTGDNDGTVYWHQSVELYNIARRAKKNVVMLVYNGEDHGLRQRRNQVDYHRRIRAWFDHYLKDAPAETWITEGVSAMAREAR